VLQYRSFPQETVYVFIPARIALTLAVLVWAGSALAAGVREEAIALDFPERLGDFTLKGRTQFPQKGEGATIVYEGRDVRGAVYVYNAGMASIPTGVGDPVIHRHFQQTVAALQQATSQSPGSLKPLKGSTISAFKGCGPQFMWRADEISLEGKSLVTRTYLAGFRNHFVKLRVTHPKAGAAAAEDFVQQVRRLVGACA
jgi:hypothetical protein